MTDSTRRDLLRAAAAAPALGLAATLPACAAGPTSAPDGSALPRDAGRGRHVAVVGAGAFGGWTAWHLLRAGCRVTLVDAWGPGNARSSSGGDTRVLRLAYGPDRVYQDLAARARRLWLEHERLWGTRLFERTGLLWLVQDDDAYERAAVEQLADAGLAVELLEPDAVAERFPQVALDGVRWALTEADAGIVSARRSCRVVADAFVAAGGELRPASVAPRPPGDDGLRLADGGRLHADAYVLACGPWLARLLPEVAGGALVVPTRQEVFTFGVPAGDVRHEPPALPVWADHGARFWYGIPGNEGRGFKLADDTRGEPFDPTDGDRTPTPEALERARAYLATRFPALADAPLLESRTCQYSMTADGDFVVDRHPDDARTWVVGGGSGHGFKHGPALGELAAGCVLGVRDPEPRFRLGDRAG